MYCMAPPQCLVEDTVILYQSVGLSKRPQTEETVMFSSASFCINVFSESLETLMNFPR